MTDKEKRYWAYFLNVNGKIEYYEEYNSSLGHFFCLLGVRIIKDFCI